MSDAGHDEIGAETLNAMAVADAFNHWTYEAIRPYCREPILEIGSGIGNISGFFIRSGAHIMLSDLREEYCAELRTKFSGASNLIGVAPIDLILPSFDEAYRAHIGAYGTVVILNVLEHIENDALAMQNLKKLLKPGGTLIVLVPSYQWLFCQFDVELGHYRRFTRKRLVSLFEENGFTVARAWYFNSLGLAGWFLFGKVLKKKQIQEGQMKLYNLLVPIIKLMDAVLLRSMGLSVIAVGKAD
jgi:SAM-dependent methyltransferase